MMMGRKQRPINDVQRKAQEFVKQGIPQDQAIKMAQAMQTMQQGASIVPNGTGKTFSASRALSGQRQLTQDEANMAYAGMSMGNMAGGPSLGMLLGGLALAGMMGGKSDKAAQPTASASTQKASLGDMGGGTTTSSRGNRVMDTSNKPAAQTAAVDKNAVSDVYNAGGMIAGAAMAPVNPLAAAGIAAGGDLLGSMLDDSGKQAEEQAKNQERMMKQERLMGSITGQRDYYMAKNADMRARLMSLGMR